MNQELFEEGLRNRREVLGAAHVDGALAQSDAFSRPWQELMTQYCWGEIWGRPGLERKTRSMLNLAMLVALNRPDEFKVHVRGALQRRQPRGDRRDPAADGDLCRRARGQRRVQGRARGVRRDRPRGGGPATAPRRRVACIGRQPPAAASRRDSTRPVEEQGRSTR
jgi:4-carboxymuconolactone decarboxylase